MIIGDSIELSTKIGVGAYGSVFIGVDKNTGKEYAVKKIAKDLLLKPAGEKHINNEIYILRHLPKHKNIIEFSTVIETISNIYILFEYCNGGTLDKSLQCSLDRKEKPFSEEVVRYILKSIASGLICLKEHNIIHRDIKRENIILHYKNKEDLKNNNVLNAEIKIIDFGFARYLKRNEFAKSIIGTPLYMDPKILLSLKEEESKTCQYDYKADIWSLGIVAYHLLMGVIPFNSEDYDGLINSITKRKFCFEHKVNLSKEAIQFIDRILSLDNTKRFSAEEIITDKWIVNRSLSGIIMELKDDRNISSDSFENYWKVKKNSQHILRIRNIIEAMQTVETIKRVNTEYNYTERYQSPIRKNTDNNLNSATPKKEENHFK